jgi:transcription-repair coupling factor (superfamily II helicase)
MEAAFVFEDTFDQAKATLDVKQDMESPNPMDRLICGDVGFGKTEVAVRAAFKAVMNGKQVAVLVPTTILALQHFNTFVDRLSRYSVDVAALSRLKSKREQAEILGRLVAGTIDIIIGTHRLLSSDVVFKDLGLLVVDEEHRFGVAAKEKLRQKKAAVDTITLTATPIPRTLHFSLMGARDLSIIATPPRNRLPIMPR